MKVKTFGFRWKQPLPGNLPIQNFLQFVSRGSNAFGGGYELYLCRERAEGDDLPWWVGVILRIRDSTNYTALKENEEGKRVISAESLKDGKLVEPSFLIAHPITGNGLFTSHHLAASLTTFSFLAENRFKAFKEFIVSQEMEGVPPTSAKARGIRNAFKGKLELQQFCHPNDFPALIKQFEKISKTEWTITELGTHYKPFHALWNKAKTRKFLMAFDEEFITTSEIANAVIGSARTDTMAEIKVSGRKGGNDCDVFLNKPTKQLFGEREYDAIVGEMSLDLDNWGTSLANSKIISWLKSLADEPDVRREIEEK